MKRKHPVTEITKDSTVHLHELQELTELSEGWLIELASKGYYPKPNDRQFNVYECVRGLIRHFKEVAERKNSANAQLAVKRAAEAEENTLLKRANRYRIEGKMLEREAVERVWADHITGCRTRLQSCGLSKKDLASVLRELEVKAEEYTK